MKRFIPLLNIALVFGLLVAGCAPAPTPQVVEKEVVIEKVVEETVIVEVEKPVEVVEEVPVIDFSTDLDEQNEPVGAATSFPPGVERICGSFLPGSDISTRDLGWVALGYEEVPTDDCAMELLAASESGRVGFCIYSGGLPPGEHIVEVYDVDGNLLASGTFEIK